MDGVGIGKPVEGNAVWKAYTPNLDWLEGNTLNMNLGAHGTFVGLPSDSDIGNSEVGHNALGAGRVVSQGAKLVNQAIESGAMFQSDSWKELVQRCIQNHTAFHFIGLLSDGNVHSHIEQVFALIRRLNEEGVEKVRIHPLFDGRDVDPISEPKYIQRLESLLSEINQQADRDYIIASGGGRMVTTMDRYNANWDVVKNGWDAHVLGKSREFHSAEAAIQAFRDETPGIQDQNLPSFVVVKDGKPVGPIQDGDSVVFFNFRGDRAIEISRAFEEKEFTEFDRERYPDVLYAGMMEYDGDLHIPKNFLVAPPVIRGTISEYFVKSQRLQFAISETQKYGHVTYFWNGNRSGYIDETQETYREVPSDKLTFDKRAWMKAGEITDEVIQLLQNGQYHFGRVNYANGDMVGHTGDYHAAVIAVSTVDHCIGRILPVIKALNGIALITADHGNADIMYTEKDGKRSVVSAHTKNPVPFYIYDPGYQNEYELATDLKRPGLSNVAATLAFFMGFEPPEGYDPALVKPRS